MLFISDFTPSVPLLTRLSFAHTSVLPGLLTLLIIAHLFLVKHHGISPLPVRQERSVPNAYEADKKGVPTSRFDLHLRQLVGYGLLLAVIASLLALAIPATLGEAVVLDREVTKPPWLFWWLYAFENFWGLKALLWASIAVPLGLLVVPFLDQTPFRHMVNRKWVLVLGLALAITWIALTVYVWLTPVVEHIEMEG